jgi:hypothetical protein
VSRSAPRGTLSLGAAWRTAGGVDLVRADQLANLEHADDAAVGEVRDRQREDVPDRRRAPLVCLPQGTTTTVARQRFAKRYCVAGDTV